MIIVVIIIIVNIINHRLSSFRWLLSPRQAWAVEQGSKRWEEASENQNQNYNQKIWIRCEKSSLATSLRTIFLTSSFPHSASLFSKWRPPYISNNEAIKHSFNHSKAQFFFTSRRRNYALSPEELWYLNIWEMYIIHFIHCIIGNFLYQLIMSHITLKLLWFRNVSS